MGRMFCVLEAVGGPVLLAVPVWVLEAVPMLELLAVPACPLPCKAARSEWFKELCFERKCVYRNLTL